MPNAPWFELAVIHHTDRGSSCGVCGKASQDAVRLTSRYPLGDEPARVAAPTLTTMPVRWRSAQRVFASTGGLHAAALFDVDGAMHVVREISGDTTP
jgi:FdhD protein